MGRDNRVNFFHYSSKKHEVTCGCFKGTLEELKAKVRGVHGDSEHGQAYMDQIKIMEYLIKQVKGAKEKDA